MTLHPGPNGEFSVVRWTAQFTGRITIKGEFYAHNNYTTTDVHVFHGSTEIVPGTVLGGGPRVTFDTTTAVTLGQTIDFVVGIGGNNFYADTTGLKVDISELTPVIAGLNVPTTFPLGFFSDAGTNDIPSRVTVNWGDGDSSQPTEVIVTRQGQLAVFLSHTYQSIGIRTVIATAKHDADAASQPVYFDVQTVETDESVTIVGADTTTEGAVYSLDLTSWKRHRVDRQLG